MRTNSAPCTALVAEQVAAGEVNLPVSTFESREPAARKVCIYMQSEIWHLPESALRSYTENSSTSCQRSCEASDQSIRLTHPVRVTHSSRPGVYPELDWAGRSLFTAQVSFKAGLPHLCLRFVSLSWLFYSCSIDCVCKAALCAQSASVLGQTQTEASLTALTASRVCQRFVLFTGRDGACHQRTA